ncbi:MAG: PD-(D/E)XK nuclease family protein, partial [Planctomycetota bacterium]
FSYSSLIAGGAAIEVQPDRADRPADIAPPAIARGIFAFARGPAAGQCLHHVLEHVDFARLDEPATTVLVRDSLDAFGLLAPEAHAGEIDPVAAVVQNLRDLAAARVHAGGPTLRALCGGTRAVEWEFTLPANAGTLAQLAEVLRGSASAIARVQAERLRALPPSRLDGFLVGFVDLLAEHDGRHWVLDWKSNHLGNAVADYGSDALAGAMAEHDYVLQYHLYVLALHRLLRARLPGYDYDRHVGGVCYVFLRGATPDTATGMFHDRVPRDVVLAMDNWLAGGGSR